MHRSLGTEQSVKCRVVGTVAHLLAASTGIASLARSDAQTAKLLAQAFQNKFHQNVRSIVFQICANIG